MTEPTPNVALLRQVLGHITTHPCQWDQRVWRSRCGTAMCYAGWACQLTGARWHWAPDAALVEAVDDDPPEYVMEIDGTRWIHARYRAQRVLGLTPTEADDLFHASNNLRYLEQAVEELCAKAEGRPVDEDDADEGPADLMLIGGRR